jgi:hypothetical protein
MNRRKFIHLTTLSAVAHTLPAQIASNARSVSLNLQNAPTRIEVSQDFIGLGYEMSSVARMGLLRAGNSVYLQLVRQLGPRGTMRFGGIVADHTRYEPQGTPKLEPDDTILTRAAIDQVVAFLRATGWQAIWSVNFGTGTLENAIAELRDVSALLGNRLIAVEIGNEVEAYSRGRQPHRPGGYTYDQYRAEYAKWHEALSGAVPHLQFAAPDTAGNVEWVERMAADNNGTAQILTTHYYRAGQQNAEPEQLRVVDDRLRDKVQHLSAASAKSGLPWRICETNSYSGGGHPGLSDTLLGALWTLDYMLFLATSGCAGVNIETGVNQLGFVSSYSPIQDDEHGRNWAGAPYYGMLAARAALAGNRNVLAVSLENAAPTLTAYAFGETAARPAAVVVINRHASEDARIDLGALGKHLAHAAWVSGSGKDVTFSGSTVSADGTWRPGRPVSPSRQLQTVPAMSAVVLTTKPLHVP